MNNSIKKRLFLLLGCLTLLLNIFPSFVRSEKQFNHLIENGGFIVRDGSGSLHYREREPFIPASTLKIVTCLAALEILGEEYRFETGFFLDDQHNLFIKGYGDPFLTSEVVKTIAEQLYSRGVRNLLSIYLDESSYALHSLADGAGHSPNPYDAPNGALAVNFNSVPVFVSPDGTITSAETETPEVPIMHEIGRTLSPGTHRINVNSVRKQRSLSPPLRYTGELLTALFIRVGITIQNGFQAGRTPDHLRAVYTHRSEKNVREMVRSCLKYSNNFIANQLFLACGTAVFGYPASWDKSRRLFKMFAKERLHLSAREYHLLEGSGLSRNNRVSPAGLVKAVERFRPYADLLNCKEKNLLKSGTLSNVFCYAGFLAHRSRYIPFVIMLNQRENNRDKLLKALSLAVNDNF